MAYKLATAYVDIQARMGMLGGQMNQVESMLSGLLNRINAIAGAFGISAGIFGGIQALRSFIGEAKEAYEIEAKLVAVIRATGKAAGFSAGEISEMAKALEQATAIDADEISSAAAKLLTFKKITGDTFKEALTLAADLKSTGFGGMQGAAIQLGKALEDPVRGITALRRSGVSFTEQEKKKIKALVESNKLLEAQRMILDAVAGQVGGVAKERGQSPAGQWDAVHLALKQVAEDLGMIVLPYAIATGKAFVAISQAAVAIIKPVSDINNFLGGWPVKIALAYGGIVLFSKALGGAVELMRTMTKLMTIQNVMAGWSAFTSTFSSIATNLRTMPTLIRNVQKQMHMLMHGYIKPVSMGFVSMPGLIAKIGTAWKALVVSMTTGTLLTGWGAILVAIGAVLAAAVGLFFYLKSFPKIQESWSKLATATLMAFESLWNLIAAFGQAFYGLLKPLIGEVHILKTLFEEGLVAAVVEFSNMMTMSMLSLTAVIRVMNNHLMDTAKLLVAIATRDIVALSVLAYKATKLKGEFTRELLDVTKEFTQRLAGKKSSAGMPDTGGGTSVETKSGIVGLQDAWRDVQESLLKKNDPAERTAAGVEGIEAISERLLEETVKTNTLLATSPLAVA